MFFKAHFCHQCLQENENSSSQRLAKLSQLMASLAMIELLAKLTHQVSSPPNPRKNDGKSAIFLVVIF